MQISPRRNAKCHNKFIKFNCAIFILVKHVENETGKECWVTLWEKLSFYRINKLEPQRTKTKG